MVKLDKCVRSCKLNIWFGSYNTRNDLSNKAYVPKSEDLKIYVFNMITGKKDLTKDVSCEFKCKFDERKSNLD